jgi:hypothetical protein
LLSYLKGAVFILSGSVCLGFIGCGIPYRGIKSMEAPIPPSNIQVEEKVIALAINNLGIPEGHGNEVRCVAEGDDKAHDMVRIIAPEILLGYNYRILEKNSPIPELRFAVDTLYVTLTIERSKLTGKRIKRFAEAHISAIFLQTDGTRQVYRGTGTFDDSFASHMLQSVRSRDPYVIDLVSGNRLTEKFKPLVIGVALTVLAWTLYSYRG